MKWQRLVLASLCVFVLALGANTALAASVLYVDDDGAQCPGAYSSIQAAVDAATAGSTILVCPGTYHGAVSIVGHLKDGLQLLANGDQEEVVLEGDHVTWLNGFLLQDVNGVRIRGFTVKSFGLPRLSGQVGRGANIRLFRANDCIIEHNVLTDANMYGIILSSSAGNVCQHNVIYSIDPMGSGCGFHLVSGPTANNLIRKNVLWDNPGSNIMLIFAGSGNVVEDNNLKKTGRFGIFNRFTSGTRIENNHVNQTMGFDESRLPADHPSFFGFGGIGIDVRNSSGVTVTDNKVRDSARFDVFWDLSGVNNTFSANRCQVSSPSWICE